MVFAAAGDPGIHQFLLLLHILSVTVAFAPAFVWAITGAKLRRSGDTMSPPVAKVVRDTWNIVYGPALVLAGLFGIGLISTAPGDSIDFSQTWISIALFLWFLMVAVVFLGLPWNERKALAGDSKAQERSAALNGIIHLLLVLMLVDMIWQPGRL